MTKLLARAAAVLGLSFLAGLSIGHGEYAAAVVWASVALCYCWWNP